MKCACLIALLLNYPTFSASAKFDFGIFENFAANEEMFAFENAIIHQMETTRKVLTRNAEAIRSLNSSRYTMAHD